MPRCLSTGLCPSGADGGIIYGIISATVKTLTAADATARNVYLSTYADAAQSTSEQQSTVTSTDIYTTAFINRSTDAGNSVVVQKL